VHDLRVVWLELCCVRGMQRLTHNVIVNLNAILYVDIYAVVNVARHVQYGERVSVISLCLYGHLKPIHPVAVALAGQGRRKKGAACEGLVMLHNTVRIMQGSACEGVFVYFWCRLVELEPRELR
jgi:hypothetical protein